MVRLRKMGVFPHTAGYSILAQLHVDPGAHSVVAFPVSLVYQKVHDEGDPP